jgi:hypothetical protein
LLVHGRPDDLKAPFNASNLEEVFERAVQEQWTFGTLLKKELRERLNLSTVISMVVAMGFFSSSGK